MKVALPRSFTDHPLSRKVRAGLASSVSMQIARAISLVEASDLSLVGFQIRALSDEECLKDAEIGFT